VIEKRASSRPQKTTEETNEQVPGLATQHILPTEISWPKPIVKSRRWWAVAYGLSLGSASFLAARFPSIGAHPWYLLMSVGVAPLSYALIEHWVHWATVTYQRLTAYNALYEFGSKSIDALNERDWRLSETQSAIQYLVQEFIPHQRIIEVQKVQYWKEEVFLHLRGKRGQKIAVGMEVKVIDLELGSVMGTFIITQTTPTCQAKAARGLDPIWLGFIRNAGGECSLPADSVAILLEGSRLANE
jgi:hypothetical protein